MTKVGILGTSGNNSVNSKISWVIWCCSEEERWYNLFLKLFNTSELFCTTELSGTSSSISFSVMFLNQTVTGDGCLFSMSCWHSFVIIFQHANVAQPLGLSSVKCIMYHSHNQHHQTFWLSGMVHSTYLAFNSCYCIGITIMCKVTCFLNSSTS